MLTYKIKVRRKNPATPIYLWGGRGVLKEFKKEILLFMRVDEEGETVTIGVDYYDGVLNNEPEKKRIATLEKGESFAVDLKGVKGVYANCEFDTGVTCTIVPLED
jgi:hypothetical protein